MRKKEFTAKIQSIVNNKDIAGSIHFYLSQKSINLDDNETLNNILKILATVIHNNPYLHEKSKKYQKEFIKQFLDKEFISNKENYTALLPAERLKNDDSTEQRRMDSFARILSLSDELTPCIAISFINNQLIIGYNPPRDKTETQQMKKEEKIQCYLTKRIEIISSLLKCVTPEVLPKDRLRLLVLSYIDILLEQGGTGVTLPVANRKHKNLYAHLQNALEKMVYSYASVENDDTVEVGKFNSHFANAINKQNFIFASNRVVNKDNKVLYLHAEQAILFELKKQNLLNSNQAFFIGISKLCCLDCQNELSKYENIYFRGGHGEDFINTARISTMDIRTKKNRSSAEGYCPSDSESDSEYMDKDENQFNRIRSKGQ